MRLAAASALAMMATTSAAGPADADPVAPHLWRSRLVVAVAPLAGDMRLDEQRRILAGAKGGATERDLVLVTASGNESEAAALRRRFGIPRDAFRAILVGKDGGAKLVSDEPLSAEAVFAEIDTMPMRRDEMARGRETR